MAKARKGQLDATADSYANGSILDSRTLAISSDGATITATVSADVGTTLTFRFSDGLLVVDFTAPKTVTLTAGSDTVPQENFLYFLKTDPTTLVASNVSFPTAEYAPIGRIIVQSATKVQADGVLKQHDYTDHTEDNNDQGHLTHINSWIREQWATWISGVAPTITGSGTGSVTYAMTSGVVRQLHEQSFPAFVNPASMNVINDSVTPYLTVTDFATSLLDSLGGSLNNRYYNIIVWGVASKGGSGESKLFYNLPSGSYVNASAAQEDLLQFSNFSIPTQYKGTGFLIERILIRNQASSTFTVQESEDLRGQIPNTVAGTSVATATEFPDSTFTVFNNADNTKKTKLDVSGVATATTRTMTVPDKDGTIAMLSDLPVEILVTALNQSGFPVIALGSTPAAPALVEVYRGGNEALYTTNYTVSGSDLTWVAPSLVNEDIVIRFNATGVNTEKLITYTIEHIVTGSIVNGTYRFSRPRFSGTILAIYGILNSGTADLDLEISSVAVTHTTLNLSSTETNQSTTATNTFTNSDNIEYVITNASSADRLVLTLECTGVI